GVNQGPGVDSKARYIYIHGTANERAIGTACSMGCVRMLNRDVIQLFELVAPGTPVVILDN
nr:L,D-transpeptidase [Flavobacteriales bacterium]